MDPTASQRIKEFYLMQVDFLFDAYEDIIGDEPLSFLELGCGPGQHSLEMAESKLTVYCVDMQTQMLEYAASLAAEDDLEMTCIEGDMRNFRLPVCCKPFLSLIFTGFVLCLLP